MSGCQRQHCAPCSRREFLSVAAAPLIAGALACSSGSADPLAPDQPYAEILENEIRIRLAMVPEFTRDNAYLVIYEANVIALHLTGSDYRAFTNICTHAGCGIQLFHEGRFRCQCHGSEYDIDGTNVAGPAPLPLRRHTVNLDAASTILSIDRRS